MFEGVSLAMGPGEAALLRGPNGIGKSSLLRLLAGFLPPADGTLHWAGADIAEDIGLYRTQLHYVGHLDGVKPVLSVRENVRLYAQLLGNPQDEDQALDHFGLLSLADLPARYLSAGQRRRLNLARLAAANRPLWLLDEPTVSLDAESVAQLEALIERHLNNGGMAIIATHLDMQINNARILTLGTEGIT